MIYFLLPSVHPLTFKNIKVDVRDIEPPLAVSQSLSNYINEIKEKIASREKDWDLYKKYTNPYEYIHSVVPYKKKAVSKYKPISRSYFKMIEIITEFQIIPASNLASSISSDSKSGSTEKKTVQVHRSEFPPSANLPVYENRATPTTTLPPPPGLSVIPIVAPFSNENSNPLYPLLHTKSMLPNHAMYSSTNTLDAYRLWDNSFVQNSVRISPLGTPYQTTTTGIREMDWDAIALASSSASLRLYTPTYLNYEMRSVNQPALKQSASEGPDFYSEWRRVESPLFSFPVNPSRNPPPIRTFHLAEGPGGFIEAVCNRRNNRADQYYGMTILVDKYDDNVPAWNKTSHFLAQHPNIHIETGADGTGNLLHMENFNHCVEKYGGTMDLVTADGGFDFSKDFNKQEVSITNLLWGQVCYALALQRQGGNFVLKIFDCFYEHTIDILYILSAFYSEVIVSKLQTSRVGNSEKYVICKGFRFSSGSFFAYSSSSNNANSHKLPHRTMPTMFEPRKELSGEQLSSSSFLSIIRESFQKICVEVNPFSSSRKYVWRILGNPVPRHFTKQIEDMNAVFGQQQIENIHYTIYLIDKQTKTDKSDQIIRQNINKCINWCIEHEIPYNNLANTNVFIHSPSMPELQLRPKNTNSHESLHELSV